MNKAKIDKLIEVVLKICEEDITNVPTYERTHMPFFHKLYPTSNEAIQEFFPKLNLKNASVMTVGSSGDQILYALMFGAKEVVCVDINPFTKFFYDLKVAGIKHFDFFDFNEYFGYYHPSQEILNAGIYRQISHLLPEDSKYFWDNIFLETNNVPYFFRHSLLVNSHYSINKEQYCKLKETLKNPCPVKFKCGDIKDISKNLGTKKFDVILLSNIYDYIGDWKINHNKEESVLLPNDHFSPQQKEYFAVCNRFLQALNPNGFIQVHHSWNKAALECTGSIFEEVFDKYKVMKIETSLGGGPIIVQNISLEKELER